MAKPKTKAKAKPAKAKPAKVKPAKAKPAKAKAKAKAAPKPKVKPTVKPKAKPAPAPAPTPTPGLLRGIALVDAALAVRRQGTELTGMSPGEIAAIDFGGKPLSPALAHWLAYREMFTLGAPQSLRELLDAELDEFANAFTSLGKYLKEPCVLFEGWGADSRRFLYLGATDDQGEYPVFTLDIDDTPFACLNGPVDVWLAQHAGGLAGEQYYGFVPEAYEPTRLALAAKCFGGNVAHVDGRFSKYLS
jgi:hypothetical protein